ncbi:adenine deaminase C-terminal domain-containing protein [Alicyclobacillus dauci]|uniref:adenine deaminase n=1 Tax=Alicyclobacillus dauci TaxID=1475485 RepID=A0ABY6Z6W1_9BACL|nr:adenine deaminase C-terminal domain-containing protein [Alicyclobacillus dauci]WAH38016.1 amidohydrolase family protein [Alicyclobacillus dauci]
MTTRVRPMTREQYANLIAVSRFRKPATVWIRDAKVLQVYTGEIERLNVALWDKWIAYVGERSPMVDDDTQIIDAAQYYLVPGYIEPHAHSFQGYNPKTLADFAAVRGTTLLIQDNLPFFLNLDQTQMESVFAEMSDFPVKHYWWCRLDPQIKQEEAQLKFTMERVEQTLSHPLVLQAGELTFWKDLIDADETMADRGWRARESGKRLETHNPGASPATLNAVAAAGATACHESISAKDVLERVRLGYHAALRHSSIRPDLYEIVRGLLAEGFTAWDRVSFTTDGSPPFFLRDGLIDACVRIAIEAGLDPAIAYRVATLNVAVYYGLDAELGGISPGRIADILFLEDLRNPMPVKVMTDGRLVAEDGRLAVGSPDVDWTALGCQTKPMFTHSARSEWFEVGVSNGQAPVMEYVNAVITRYRTRELPTIPGRTQLMEGCGCMYSALLSRTGEWITTSLVAGFGEFDALATTYTLSGDLVVLGRDPEQMALAVNRVRDSGGGITLFHGGECLYELSLPLLGTMSRLSMDQLIEETSRFVELMVGFGYTHADPLYSLLFMSATHLPSIRLAPEGLLEVKSGRVLAKSRRLRGGH